MDSNKGNYKADILGYLGWGFLFNILMTIFVEDCVYHAILRKINFQYSLRNSPHFQPYFQPSIVLVLLVPRLLPKNDLLPQVLSITDGRHDRQHRHINVESCTPLNSSNSQLEGSCGLTAPNGLDSVQTNGSVNWCEVIHGPSRTCPTYLDCLARTGSDLCRMFEYERHRNRAER